MAMNSKIFQNRREAGRQLAEKLTAYANRRDVTVLALPRGGVPVAYEVARALRAPLDVFVVRKLGLPGHEELAMGAVATGGVRVLNQELVDSLGLPPHLIDTVAARELEELKRRERVYRGGRPPPDVRGRTVILVDDGLATGATMQAAIKALRELAPARIVVAVPTAPMDTCQSLRAEADEVICDITPEPFFGVGVWYADFSQTSDDEVRALLAQSAVAEAPAASRSAESAAEAVRQAAVELRGSARDYDPLLERIGDAQFVLLGEASHGTHEFYRERAEITKRLFAEMGFSAVAVEADWPDAYRVNRYVRGASDDLDAAEALADFRRFPTWMWCNTVVAEFVEWQRAFNQSRSKNAAKTGFYGLDLYSLRGSMKAVLQYLDRIDPEAAKRARHRYACFDRFGEEAQTYGFMTSLNLSKTCEEEVVKQLADLRSQVWEAARRTGRISEDDIFYVEQNARLVKNAEAYYRTMFLKEESTWNLRDRHMMETLEAVGAHLGRDGTPVKMVVWAHNSHLGDARATEMGRRGELNLGQLVRERHGRNAVLVGFTTHHGTVTAASDWDGPPERKNVRPALAGSYEALFHEAHLGRFLLTSESKARAHLQKARLERAIGVIYRPATERLSHYFDATLPEQFDAILHFDETRAVEPLAINAEWQAGEVPETYPFGV
jgi:erythromycin esterase-like protein/predicted phosphoribosyltransferase